MVRVCIYVADCGKTNILKHIFPVSFKFEFSVILTFFFPFVFFCPHLITVFFSLLFCILHSLHPSRLLSTHPMNYFLHIFSPFLFFIFILLPPSLLAVGSLQSPAPSGSCDRGPRQDVHRSENIRAGLRGSYASSHCWSVENRN